MTSILNQISSSPSIREVFLLSTAHRTEVYLRGQSSASEDIRSFWQERAGVSLEVLTSTLYEKRDTEAVYHLYTLGAGLGLQCTGSTDTLGLIKASLAAAREAGTVAGYLDTLMERALKVGRRVRREAGLTPDPAQLEQAQETIRQEAARFIRWARSRRAAKAIIAMRQRAEDIRQAELAKMEPKLRLLSVQEREALEALTLSIVNKLLHPSRKALREAASLSDASDYLQAASELFDLDDP
jgi:glutamyl-tRNA reductase